MYGDARFTNTNDDTRLHGVRSGYWKDGVHGREWMFSKSGLMEATKGYDLKKVVDVLKQCGWLIPDSEGRANTQVKFKNNETGEKRLYFIRFNSDVDIEKNTGTAGTAGTTTNGAAFTVPNDKNITGTTGTNLNKQDSAQDNSTQSTQPENKSGTATAHEWRSGTRSTQGTHEKNNTQSETEEKINSRSNVMEI